MDFTFETFLPPKYAEEFVMNFWYFESNVTTTYLHHATASIFPKLVFGLQGSFYRALPDGNKEVLVQCGLNAQTDVFSRLETNLGNTAAFGVILFPNSIFRLTGYPAELLNNIYLDLNTIWQNEGALLEEQVMTATDNSTRVNIISAFLRNKWDNNVIKCNELAIANAVYELSSLTGFLDINSFANKYSLSLRQFERNFKSLTGFSPKYFNRISRFERSTDLCLQKNLFLTDIAYNLGYFDQSHFIKDFKQFSGLPPSSYQQQASSDIIFTQK